MALHSTHVALVVAIVSFFITATFAGFDPSSSSNIAIYWGQNSYGAATGTSNAQQRLSYYCSNVDIDIIPLAFLDEINTPLVNFANAGDNCTVFSGTTLLDCPQLEEDIQTCQSTYDKTIMLSIGGATYTEGGFSSASAASAAADTIWEIFGPEQSDSSVNRPFGKAVVDGFDFDFESSTSNMATFASELRSKMDAATAEGDKSYYLSAAPQCPYPDVADNDMLAGGVSFDFIMVQFYNNYCGLQSYVSGSSTQSNFNFGTWDDWAKTSSKNPNVRVFLGIPGGSTAAGSGYVSDSSLASIITYTKTFSSFGGVMVWDMSQVYANPGFLDLIADSLQSGATSPSTTASTSATTEPATSSYAWPTYTTSTFASYSSSAPTTLSTDTRSASRSTDGDTGSCGTPATATVTLYVTVAESTGPAITSGATKTSLSSTPAQSTATEGAQPVAQWGQCGGVGYSGSTQCASPYTCVANGKWWAQCQ